MSGRAHIRPTHRLLALLAAGGVAVSLAAVPTAADATTTHRHTVHVAVGAHHRVTAPRSLAPGIVHLVDASRRPVLVLQSLRKNATAAQVAKAFAPDRPKAAVLRRTVRILGAVAPGQDLYTRLRRGHVFLSDANASKVTAADLTLVTVRGAVQNAVAPPAPTLSVGPAAKLRVPSSIGVGRYLRLSNPGNDLVVLFALRVGSHTTDKQLAALIAAPSTRKLDSIDIVHIGPMLIVPLGGSYVTRFAGGRGRYLMIGLDAAHPGRLVKGQVGELIVR